MDVMGKNPDKGTRRRNPPPPPPHRHSGGAACLITAIALLGAMAAPVIGTAIALVHILA